jgi:hypothetical protein
MQQTERSSSEAMDSEYCFKTEQMLIKSDSEISTTTKDDEDLKSSRLENGKKR